MVYYWEDIERSVRTEQGQQEPDTWQQFIKCLLAICVKSVSDLLKQQLITQLETETAA